MTQQDKDLLLRDLCARLPYKTLIHIDGIGVKVLNYADTEDVFINCAPLHVIKPYLRPISSMTHSEYDEYLSIKTHGKPFEVIDWLNARHIDYRKLIDKGLAIAVTDENNPYKQ